jgi:signal transduction histidine kinase
MADVGSDRSLGKIKNCFIGNRMGRWPMATASLVSARISKHTLAPYVTACLATVAGLFIRSALNPLLGEYAPYVTLFPALAFCAWYCGVGPSVLSVILSLFGVHYWVTPSVPPPNPNMAQSIGMFAFLLASGIVVYMGEVRRRENERMRKEQRSLEERVQERTEALDSANQSLHALSARLLQLQDEERRRFARELHDSVGQSLAGLTLNLSAVRTDIERLARTASTLNESEAMVQEMSREVRTISYLLHPPMLDESGLASALRWYVEGFTQRSKIQVEAEFPDDFGRLPQELETAVFRVVQECLTNIHRHSGSPTAKVRLARFNDFVLVEVADRGKGIAPEKRDEMETFGTLGVGLRGMRERILQLGGSMKIDSNGPGTVVRVQIPMAHGAETAAA